MHTKYIQTREGGRNGGDGGGDEELPTEKGLTEQNERKGIGGVWNR